MRFVDRLKHNEDHFTRSQASIAAFMRNNMESIAFSTLETLASKVGVSTTTIIRFSRAIGYSGFGDMQQSVQDELQNKSTLPERLDSMEQTSGNALLHESFSIDLDNIRQTLMAQNDQDLSKAVQWISQAGKIYILGMRSSFSTAYYMASRLGEIKKNIHFIQSTGMLYPEEIVGAEPEDVCIAYFFPRYSKTATNILSWLKSRGVKTILFTAMNNLAIRGYGDINLPCATKSASYKNSLTAPICLTNYLVAELAKQNYEEAREVLSRTEDILSTGYYLGL
ncbi:MAG: MurR/RpiR family transcriptional regulator [Eubacteriales bacterium]|jgi:DNA-binding MurR/RpiR family transcriptional regulator